MTGQRGYDEGHEDGRVAEILKRHERHFDEINGSQKETVRELSSIRLMLQQIIDTADYRAASSAADLASRDATVISVATALEKKEEAKRDSSTQRWTPWQRALALVAGLATVIGAVVTIIATR